MAADNKATFATADGIAVGTVDYMSPSRRLAARWMAAATVQPGLFDVPLDDRELAYPGESPIDRLGRRISARPTRITDLIPDLPSAGPRARQVDGHQAPGSIRFGPGGC